MATIEIKFNQLPKSIQSRHSQSDIAKVEVLNAAGPTTEEYRLTSKKGPVYLYQWSRICKEWQLWE